MPDVERFPSKIGGWCIWAAAAILGFVWAITIRQMMGDSPDVGMVVVMAVATAFAVWVLTSIYYVVTTDYLETHGAGWHRVIPLAQIRTMKPSDSILAAPAASTDRIELAGDFGVVLVSPRDKAGFVRAILDRAPGVTADETLRKLVAEGLS